MHSGQMFGDSNMARLQKRVNCTEAVAETMKVEPITLPKESGPWILVEVEMDMTMPARPAAAGLSTTEAAFGNTKTQPTQPSLAEPGAISSQQAYRSATDTMCVVGPYRWDGAELLQLEGEYYYAWCAVKSGSQAAPAAATAAFLMTFVTPDELK